MRSGLLSGAPDQVARRMGTHPPGTTDDSDSTPILLAQTERKIQNRTMTIQHPLRMAAALTAAATLALAAAANATTSPAAAPTAATSATATAEPTNTPTMPQGTTTTSVNTVSAPPATTPNPVAPAPSATPIAPAAKTTSKAAPATKATTATKTAAATKPTVTKATAAPKPTTQTATPAPAKTTTATPAPATTGGSYLAQVKALAARYKCGSTSVIIGSPIGSQGAFDGSAIYIKAGLATGRLPYVVAHECAHAFSINRVYGGDWDAASAAVAPAYGLRGDAALDALADCMSLLEGTSGQRYTTSCGGARGTVARTILAGNRV